MYRWDKDNPLVPVDSKGNLQSYPNYGAPMVRVHAFYSKMKIIGMERGRSSALFRVQDDKGFMYPMFLSEMEKVLKTMPIEDGYIASTKWTYKKQGQNYSIGLAD